MKSDTKQITFPNVDNIFQAAERLQSQLTQVTDRAGDTVPQSGNAQGSHEVSRAMAQLV